MVTVYLRPMNDNFNNNMELLNESSILLLTDLYLAFFDISHNLNAQTYLSYAFMTIVGIVALINIII